MGEPSAVGGGGGMTGLIESEGAATAQALWGCIRVPQLAMQAAVRLRPELTGRAVVVMHGVRPAERVWACDERAAELGMCPGMTRVEVETFGAVEVLSRSSADEAGARAGLMRVMGMFSPAVEEHGAGADWECVADLSGTGRLLGAPMEVGRRLARELERLGFAGRVVVCGNADAGLSLARLGRFVRGVPVQVVATGEEASALARLPLAVLALEEEQAERFAAWGLSSLGELAALPETELIVRMGQAGRTLRQRARGEFVTLHEPVAEPFVLEEMVEFDEPVETLEPLLFCLNPMLERLLLRAGSRALALASVTVALWVERCADRVLSGESIPQEPGVLTMVQAVAEDDFRADAPVEQSLNHSPRTPLDESLEARIERYGRLPHPEVEAHHSHAAGLLATQIESRLGMASADAAVRKGWHRGMLVGRGGAVKNACGVAKVPATFVASKEQAQTAAEPAVRDNDKENAYNVALNHVDVDEGRWGAPFVRTVQPAVATLNQALLLKLIQLDLQAHSPEGAVVRLRLSAVAGDASRVQLGLFAPPMPEPTRFEDTHARLQAVVGEANVGRVCAVDTHAAESFRLERFRLPEAISKAPPVRSARSRPAMALRRFRPAVEVRVGWREARLECFWFEARRFRVLRCFGPWRSSGDWWCAGMWSVDMWDLAAESDHGEQMICLLVHDIASNRWMLEGMYD